MKLSFSLSSKPKNSTLRKPSAAASGHGDTNGQESKFVTEFDSSKVPIGKNRESRIIPPKPNEWRQTKKRKNLELSLKRLPEDAGFEEFEDMPVDGFGRALLAGYGWAEGKGIGKNAKKDVDIVVLKKRTGKEGLGFTGGLQA